MIRSTFGNITLTGKSTGTGLGNQGIEFEGASIVESIGTGPTAATISLIGVGSGIDGGRGVEIENEDGRISSVDGDIEIIGSSVGSGEDNEGVDLNDKFVIESLGTGADAANIVIHGTGSGTDSNGVQIRDPMTEISSAAGNITITGIAGAGTGVDITTETDTEISAGTGDIILWANTLDLGATTSGTGRLEIRPRTAGTTIGLGSASTGTLNLDPSELANLQDGFSQIHIGRSDAGKIDIDAPVTFQDPLTIENR